LLLGLGAGAGRNSPYATEQLALGRPVGGDTARRAAVEATVATLRSVWSGTVAGVDGFLRPDPPPPIIVAGSGPKIADLAGGVADGVILADGPHLARLLEVARAARAMSGCDPSSFIVAVSSDLRVPALAQLQELEVDRVVVFVEAPFSEHVRRLASSRH
jgi:alkanesulfonate monooxygenase SsuD/methylene tetrahydromethanopterin reductase-like flavin-dependent oxidoreductase (luciferase family)